MEKQELYNKLIPKDRNLGLIVEDSQTNSKIVSYLLEGISSENARIRYGCFNALVLLSEKNPQTLYPHFNLFADFLNSDYNIIKLGAIRILSNLTIVDNQKNFDKIFHKFFSFISDPEMTPAANVVKGSVTIAKAKPYLTENVASQLLTVSQTKYKTEECKNILIGHVILTFDKIFNQLENNNPVMEFVKNNRNNPWNGTKSKAEKFLQKHDETTEKRK